MISTKWESKICNILALNYIEEYDPYYGFDNMLIKGNFKI